MTVREAVLREILAGLKMKDKSRSIASIHSAHPDHPYSGAQRLRELKKEGIVTYKYLTRDRTSKWKHYDFTGTKISDVKKALKGGRV